MTFDNTRVIIEERMLGASNAITHPVSLTDNGEGLPILIKDGDYEYAIQTAIMATDTTYETNGIYQLLIDGDKFDEPNNKTYIIMAINDVANKDLKVKGAHGCDNGVASGFVRFKIFVQKKIEQNTRMTAGLIADAIDRRLGYEAGSRISNNGRYPEDEVGGTLKTSRGSLIKVENTVSAQAFNLDFQFDYYQ